MLRACVVLAVGAVLVAPASARAQNQWERQVQGYLERAGQQFTQQGFRLSHETHTGSLAADGSELLTLQLRAGTSYQIVAVCDNDCSDIDLRIYDADGDEVGHDIQSNDQPAVAVTPRSSGSFTVAVVMWKCQTSTCFYGVGAYSR